MTEQGQPLPDLKPSLGDEASTGRAVPDPLDEDEWQRCKPSAWAPARFRDHRPPGSIFPPEESPSADDHDQVVVEAWEGTPIGVDVDIAPLLIGLWRLGYRTYVSCQGNQESARWAYIDFETPEMARRFTADFPLGEHRIENSTVRFPAAAVRALRNELRHRDVITKWEDIRDVALRKIHELESMPANRQADTEAELTGAPEKPSQGTDVRASYTVSN